MLEQGKDDIRKSEYMFLEKLKRAEDKNAELQYEIENLRRSIKTDWIKSLEVCTTMPIPATKFYASHIFGDTPGTHTLFDRWTSKKHKGPLVKFLLSSKHKIFLFEKC